MPRPRFLKLDEEKRTQILVSAAMEFAERGYDQASLNRIIAAAGLSKGAFYYYFDDKADLFGTVLEWSVKEVIPRDPPALASLDRVSFWPEIEGWMMEVAGGCQDRPWLAGLGRLFYQPPPVATGLVEELYGAFAEILERYVGRARELGLVRDDLPEPLLLAMLLAALEAGDRWMTENWDELDEGAVVVYSRKVMEAARSLVAPPAGAGP